MEFLIVISLLLVVASNVFIGLKVGDSKTPISIVNTPQSLQPVIKMDPPIVTVYAEPSDLVFDYDKLSSAIKKALMESHVAAYNATVVLPPTISRQDVTIPSNINANTGHTLYSSVEVEGVPTRQFPRT